MENEGMLNILTLDVISKLGLWNTNQITDLEIIEYVLYIDKKTSTLINLDGLEKFNYEYGRLIGAIIEKFGFMDIEDILKTLKRDDTIDNLLRE